MKSSITDGLYPRTSRSFATLAVSLFITFLRNVIAMMTGNAAFPIPSPTLAVMTAATNDLEAKTQAALNGGKVEMAARRAAEAFALSLTRQLGNYVESASNGDLTTLLSSGFDAIKAPSPSVIPTVPGNARFTYGENSGELVLRFSGGYNVKNFSIQHAANAEGPWIDHDLSTSTRVVIPNLTPGKVYWGRARANGAAGSSDWCSPASLMAI